MNQIENKKTTKVVESINNKSEAKKMSQEQLQREYDYILAQKFLKSMLETGLITEDEFHKITALNRKTFSPSLAELMP
jgi:predicted HTH transcriptional regulator